MGLWGEAKPCPSPSCSVGYWVGGEFEKRNSLSFWWSMLFLGRFSFDLFSDGTEGLSGFGQSARVTQPPAL